MRVLVANISAAPRESETGRFISDVMGPVQLRNFQLTAEAGDEFVSRFPAAGFGNPDFAYNRYVTEINLESVYHQIVRAEEEGFDGAVITCVFDPALAETRRAVSIPVVGLGEATLTMASLIGDRFGLISPTSLLTEPLLETVAHYGMGDRVVSVRAMNVPWDQQELAYFDSGEVIEDFRGVAGELVREGAEVLVPLCGLLSPLVRMTPGVEDRHPGGVVEVDGVPVADVMSSAAALLRALYAAKSAGSGWRNPQGFGDRLRPQADAAQPMEEASGFWDLTIR